MDRLMFSWRVRFTLRAPAAVGMNGTVQFFLRCLNPHRMTGWMAQCAALGVEEAAADDLASAAVLGFVSGDALRPAVPVLLLFPATHTEPSRGVESRN